VQGIGGGKAVALTRQGMAATKPQCLSVAPDGERLAALDSDGRMFILSPGGGEPRPVPGLELGARPLRWSADGRTLYVGVGSKVFRVDPVSGRSELWKQFAPPDPAGVRRGRWFTVLSADGRWYFYSL